MEGRVVGVGVVGPGQVQLRDELQPRRHGPRPVVHLAHRGHIYGRIEQLMHSFILSFRDSFIY